MLSFRKLRHSDHGQLLLNLCLALLGLYVAFIFSVHSSGVVVLCTIVSVVLHYFMLVVFMVMAAEAIHLYMKLVVVLGRTISHYVFKATIICWSKLMNCLQTNIVIVQKVSQLYRKKNCLQNQHTTHLSYTQLVIEFIWGICISAHILAHYSLQGTCTKIAHCCGCIVVCFFSTPNVLNGLFVC